MVLWFVIAGRRLRIPRYKVRLTRSLVLILPMALAAVHPALAGGEKLPGYKGIAGRTDAQTSGGEAESVQINAAAETPHSDLRGLNEAEKTIEISDEDYYAWMDELSRCSEAYQGYTIVAKGFVYRDLDIQRKWDFALIRLSMWCCAADLMPIGFYVDHDAETAYENDEWVTVRGVLEVSEDGTALVLRAEKIEAAQKPEEEYVYPFF